MQPAVHDRLRGGVRPVPVLAHDVLAPHQHFAGLTGRAVVAMGVDHPHVRVEEGFAGGVGLAQGVLGIHQARRPAGLGQAIDLQDADPHLHVLLGQRHGHRRGAGHDPAQRGVVVALPRIADLKHEVQHGGNHQTRRDLLAIDELPGEYRIERPHDDRSGPAIDVDGQRRQRADVKHRQRAEIAVDFLVV